MLLLVPDLRLLQRPLSHQLVQELQFLHLFLVVHLALSQMLMLEGLSHPEDLWVPFRALHFISNITIIILLQIH